MSHRTHDTLAPEAPFISNCASSVHDAEYHLALALLCVDPFIQEECNVEDDYAALEALVEMQAQADLQADLQRPEP